MPEDKKDKAIADLQAALEEATTKLQEQDAMIKQMTKLPGFLGQITHVLPKGRVVLDGRMLIEKPDNIKKLEEDDIVHITQTMGGGIGIVDIIKLPDKPAMIMKVAEVLPDGRALIDLGNGNMIPIKKLNGHKVEVGDRLLLGGSGPLSAVVMENLGKESNRFQFSDDLGITWDDIGGQVAAKAAMREAIEYPILHAELYKAMGKRPIKGVLLEGPPGCGKTLLAKAAAGALSKIHGKAAAQSGYIYVKGPEVLSKWVGEAEFTIRALFMMAAEHKKKHGYPAIIFIDECEALLSKRGTGVSSDMEKTIVPSFLAEMDGLGDSAAMVILATNRSERLDPAVVRDGRVDRRIRVDRPGREDTADIFRIHLQRVPSAYESAQELATHAADQVFNHDHVLCHVDVSSGERLAFTLGHCVSGAMVAGVVDRATSIVLHDAITNKRHKVVDLEPAHLEHAVGQVREELRAVDHSDDIRELAERRGEKVKAIYRVVATN